MRIYVTGVFVEDQAKAHDFYTNVLRFETKTDVPVGEYRWLTLTGRDDPEGAELLLEPAGHPAVGPYREALRADGIPAASFRVDDLDSEHNRLVALGVTFSQEPTEAHGVKTAILDDTCGNLIQLVEFFQEQ